MIMPLYITNRKLQGALIKLQSVRFRCFNIRNKLIFPQIHNLIIVNTQIIMVYAVPNRRALIRICTDYARIIGTVCCKGIWMLVMKDIGSDRMQILTELFQFLNGTEFGIDRNHCRRIMSITILILSAIPNHHPFRRKRILPATQFILYYSENL